MNLEIVQDGTDCVNYIPDVEHFIRSEHPGITQEQLESRFDAIITEYAMQKTRQGYTAGYDAETKILTVLL